MKWIYMFLNSLQNNAVTEAVQKVAESYKCKPIEGMIYTDYSLFVNFNEF